MIDEGVTDRSLFDAWAAGDVTAFNALYAKHNPRLVAFAAKVSRDRHIAEDLCQRAWEKLIERRNRGERVQSPIGLVVSAIRNLAIDHARHASFTRPLDTEELTHSNETSEKSEHEAIVLECLEQLKEQTRGMLVLHYYSGYSFEEIASMMGMKSNAVYTRVSRARAELKTMIERRLAAHDRMEGRGQ